MVFDLDGTIIDTEIYHHEAWNIALSSYLSKQIILSYDEYCKNFNKFNNMFAWGKDDIKNINYDNNDNNNLIKYINNLSNTVDIFMNDIHNYFNKKSYNIPTIKDVYY